MHFDYGNCGSSLVVSYTYVGALSLIVAKNVCFREHSGEDNSNNDREDESTSIASKTSFLGKMNLENLLVSYEFKYCSLLLN